MDQQETNSNNQISTASNVSSTVYTYSHEYWEKYLKWTKQNL